MDYNKDYKDRYEYGRKHSSARELVNNLNNYRTNIDNKEFIFVEGSSDATFYKNTSISILVDKSVYLYAEHTDDPDEEKGKKVIYSVFDAICRSETLRSELDKCLFIIDKDYEYYKEDRAFTITEGHSMECYFLEQENIKIIFSHFNLSEEEAVRFWELYKDFASKCYEFYALKGTVSHMYESGQPPQYTKENDYPEIFSFTFDSESYSFCEDKLNEELELLRDAVRSNRYAVLFYNKLYADIKGNPMMIRGHDAYRFLKQYLRQRHGITINDNLRELINVIGEMSVELDIKQINYDI